MKQHEHLQGKGGRTFISVERIDGGRGFARMERVVTGGWSCKTAAIAR
jgi:hypothetical protein